MDRRSLQRTLKELAGTNLAKAIEELEDQLNDRSQAFNELILLKSRFLKGEKSFRSNLIGEEAHSVLHSRLTDKLLALIDRLTEEDLQQAPVEPDDFLELGADLHALECQDFLPLQMEEVRRAKEPFREQYLQLAQFFQQFGELFVQAGELFQKARFPEEEALYREAVAHYQALASKNSRRFQIFLVQVNNRLPELRAANERLIATFRKVVYYLDLPRPSMRQPQCLDLLRLIANDLSSLAQKTEDFQATFQNFEVARAANEQVAAIVAEARTTTEHQKLEAVFAAEDQLIEAIRMTLRTIELIHGEVGSWAGQFKALAKEIEVSLIELQEDP